MSYISDAIAIIQKSTISLVINLPVISHADNTILYRFIFLLRLRLMTYFNVELTVRAFHEITIFFNGYLVMPFHLDLSSQFVSLAAIYLVKIRDTNWKGRNTVPIDSKWFANVKVVEHLAVYVSRHQIFRHGITKPPRRRNFIALM